MQIQGQKLHILQLLMDSDHQKLVQEIERKMAGASMHKSEQEKKQQIFEYDNIADNQFQKSQFTANKKQDLITDSQAKKSLQQIYSFYVNSYIQPRKHYDTFENVNDRKLTFQPFILFMKNFNILKTIIPLNKVKLYFKKFSNYGQYLTQQNFIFLLNQLSHEPESKRFFKISQIRQNQGINIEMMDELEKQQLYSYMELEDPKKYRSKFKNLFEPFNCHEKPEFTVKKFHYRKFSLPELRKKALPPPKDQTVEKQLYVVKNKEIVQQEQRKSPFQKAKSIFVSWDSLRSKSVAKIQQKSADLVKQKYVKQDPDDSVFLGQYNEKEKQLRKKIQRKIKQATEMQINKNNQLMNKLEKKGHRSLLHGNQLLKIKQ